jgi:hypothetical protein
MIPLVDSAIIPFDVDKIKDPKYKLLIVNQIRFFDDNDIAIVNRANNLYKAYRAKKLRSAVVARCCNFILLEIKAKKYNPNFNSKK